MLLLLRPLSVGRFAFLRPKNMAHHIFHLESELQNIPEAAPKASPSFSVSEKLARGFFRVIWRGDHVMKGKAFDRKKAFQQTALQIARRQSNLVPRTSIGQPSCVLSGR